MKVNELIKPLSDDTSEWRGKSFWRDLLGFFFTNSVLAWRLKQQLKSRPNVWGIGLWPDAETEKVARQCAEIFEEQFGLPNSSLVPDDSVMVLETWGDGLDACNRCYYIKYDDGRAPYPGHTTQPSFPILYHVPCCFATIRSSVGTVVRLWRRVGGCHRPTPRHLLRLRRPRRRGTRHGRHDVRAAVRAAVDGVLASRVCR